MRRSRLLTVFLGLCVAVGLAPVLAAPAAAATPRCTSWTTYYTRNSTQAVVHVPSSGYQNEVYNCELRLGDRNDAVKVLQRALRYCYNYTNVAVDGEYGSITSGAVRDFQHRMNSSQGADLDEDGIYGPETEDWLQFPVWTWPGNVRTNRCEHNPNPNPQP